MGGGRRRREIDDEIEAHLALRTEALVREGLDPGRARAEAERRFGGRGGRRRLRRSARRRDLRLRIADLADGLARDLRLALRQLRRRPGPATLELATFALGVGLTTATWTLVDRIVLRPLPLPEAYRLVTLQPVDSAGNALYVTSAAMWLDWREGSGGLESSGIYFTQPLTVDLDGAASRVASAEVSGAFFRTLGLTLAEGRAPTEEEALAGEPLAVVSEGFVERFLGGRFTPGQRIRVTGRSLAVVGVVRRGSEYPAETDLWVLRQVRRATVGSRNNVNWVAVARLREGASAAGVDAELDAVARGVRETDPDAAYAHGVVVLPLRDLVVGEDDARALWFLLAAVGVVLVLGSVNLAAIGVARASAARGDAAVHVALGAGPGRLVQREVVRHVVTGLAGGLAGVALAWTATGLVARAAASALPRTGELALDVRIAAVGIAVSLGAGLLAGLLPAVQAGRSGVRAALSHGAGRHAEGGRGLPGAVLVACEAALAVLLVTGAGLLARNFIELQGRDLGFEPAGVVVASTVLLGDGYRDAGRREAFWREAMDSVAALPGVASVGAGSGAPGARHMGTSFVEIEGRPPGREGASYVILAGDWLGVMGVDLLRGRTFGEDDVAGGERVALVNRAMAEAYWPGEDVVGRRVRASSMEAWYNDGEAPWLRIVGVVEDVRHWGPAADPSPALFVWYRQTPWYTYPLTVVARGRDGRAPPVAAVRAALLRADPSLAVEVERLDDRFAALLADERLLLGILTAFGALALLLATLGVYALVSFAVARRSHEIGVRSALGATRPALVRMVLVSALRVVGPGVGVGLLAAWWMRGVMEALLVGTRPEDPMAFAAAPVVLLAGALLAAWLPARRAARIDPAATLRAS